MTKANNIDDILLYATRRFARHGYENTSLRQIAQDANVGLGTTNFHFQSKENLFLCVIEQVIKEISRERRELLQSARRDGLSLERVLEAAIWPVVSRVHSSDPTEQGKPYLVRWAVMGPRRVERHARMLHDSISKEFIAAIMEATPIHDHRSAVTGWAVLVAATYSPHLLEERYENLIDVPAAMFGDYRIADCVQRVVDLVAAGLRSFQR